MIKISSRATLILMLFVGLLLAGCNGYSSQNYYREFTGNRLSKSLEDEYKEKYSEKWKNYGYKQQYSLEQLFAKKDYISLGSYYKQQTLSWNLDSKNRKSKKYCVHSLSYFIPINFWDLRFTYEQYVRKAVLDITKEKFLDSMRYIKVDDYGIGTPFYSNFCIVISGEVSGASN